MKTLTHDTIQCRWLIRRDLDRVLLIDRKCFRDYWSEEEHRLLLKNRDCIGNVFGERILGDDEIKGFMHYTLNKDHLRIERFCVDPDYRRMGLGRCAIDRLKNKMDYMKRHFITVDVCETNTGAHLFLRSQGFQCESVLHCPGDRDTYHFVWRL